jgi:anti-repressor protein
MNEIQIFNYGGNEIRTIMRDGEPWWVLKDVCNVLEIANHKNVAARLDDDEKGVHLIDSLGGKQNTTIINEPGLYNVILRSDKPQAREFKRWVTHEVLPSIRKTGGYVSNADKFIDTYFDNSTDEQKATIRSFMLNIESAKQKLIEQKPLVDFAEQVTNSVDAIDMGTFAKIVYDENIPIGRNGLFRWLRRKGYLMENNVPYQVYINKGYFRLIENVYETAYGDRISTQTLVTGKGQVFFVERLRSELVKQNGDAS